MVDSYQEAEERLGFCEHCYRMVELTPAGLLCDHFSFQQRGGYGETVLVQRLCLWSGRDPAPLPVEEL